MYRYTSIRPHLTLVFISVSRDLMLLNRNTLVFFSDSALHSDLCTGPVSRQFEGEPRTGQEPWGNSGPSTRRAPLWRNGAKETPQYHSRAQGKLWWRPMCVFGEQYRMVVVVVVVVFCCMTLSDRSYLYMTEMHSVVRLVSICHIVCVWNHILSE